MSVKGKGSQGDLNGFLDAGSHMQGELRFEDTFRIDGRLTGKVLSQGDLVVGDGGQVDGEILVGRVYVFGVVRGLVRAARRVEIGPRGKVYADLQTSSLVIEEGAFFEGRCSMEKQQVQDERAGPAPKLQPVPLQKSDRTSR